MESHKGRKGRTNPFQRQKEREGGRARGREVERRRGGERE